MKEFLRLETADFELSVEGGSVTENFRRACLKNPQIDEATNYTFPHGSLNVLSIPGDAWVSYESGSESSPRLFENSNYSFEFVFKESAGITDAWIFSALKSVADCFSFKNRSGARRLTGTLNFGNHVGRSELVLKYVKDGRTEEFAFGFDVFPTKVDFRGDYLKIVRDIEEQYPHLALSLFTKTHSQIQLKRGSSNDIIWWQVFSCLYEHFLRSVKFVVNGPRRRICRDVLHLPANRLKRVTPALEQNLANFSHLPAYRYRCESTFLTVDTPENRFLKFAVQKTSRRYGKLIREIKRIGKLDASTRYLEQIDAVALQLRGLASHQLFTHISPFGGFKQESLILQKATGYSDVYRSWIMLNSALHFFEGGQRIELKNFASLYQIWCFLRVKEMIEHILDVDGPTEIKWDGLDEKLAISGLTGEYKSRLTYILENGDRVELFHEYPVTSKFADGLRSHTVDQRPDIALRIRRSDLKDNYVLTYLFDAKYRLQSDDDPKKPDRPNEDAINQMHRYRDAIYYAASQTDPPQREVIGAFILFPGDGEIESFRKENFQRSIKTVNIGAFPLKPGQEDCWMLLEDYLRGAISGETHRALLEIIPQKELVYETSNPEVLIGLIKREQVAACLDSDAPFYYSGKSKPQILAHRNLHYFAPYIEGQGVAYYYDILRFRLVARDSIFPAGHPLHNSEDKSERLVIDLGSRHGISVDGEFLKLDDGSIRNVRYSTLFQVRNPVDGKISANRVE